MGNTPFGGDKVSGQNTLESANAAAGGGARIGDRVGDIMAGPHLQPSPDQAVGGITDDSKVGDLPSQDGENVGSVSEPLRIGEGGTDLTDVTARNVGPVWVLSLNNEQTELLIAALEATGGLAESAAEGKPLPKPFGPILKAAFGAAAPEIAICMMGAAIYIKIMNKLGGDNGVDINGVLGVHGVIVTPRLGGLFERMADLARFAVSGRTILDFVVRVAGGSPTTAAAFEIPWSAASGTPSNPERRWDGPSRSELASSSTSSTVTTSPTPMSTVPSMRTGTRRWSGRASTCSPVGRAPRPRCCPGKASSPPRWAADTVSTPTARRWVNGKPGP